MRKQLQDMAVRTSYATEHAPIKIWSESGPEWGRQDVRRTPFRPRDRCHARLPGVPRRVVSGASLGVLPQGPDAYPLQGWHRRGPPGWRHLLLAAGTHVLYRQGCQG